MGKGLGIAALAIMLVSFPIPVVGTWVGYLALALAAAAIVWGDTALSLGTAIIGIVKMYFLSPGLMLTMYAPFVPVDGESAPVGAFMFLILTTVMAALPFVALILRMTLLKPKESTQ